MKFSSLRFAIQLMFDDVINLSIEKNTKLLKTFLLALAGIGMHDGKARQALDSVEKYLATPYGIMLNRPAFSHYDKYLEEISSYPLATKKTQAYFVTTTLGLWWQKPCWGGAIKH
jgi:hypothetical protein